MIDRDLNRLREISAAIIEAAEIVERIMPTIVGPDPNALEIAIEDAECRYWARVTAHVHERREDAEREAMRAAVEPLARRALAVEYKANEAWIEFVQRTTTEEPEVVFRSIVGRALACLATARRYRHEKQEYT